MSSNCFFFGCSAEEKHHVWLGCRVIEVCVYVYVCKFVFDKKSINHLCFEDAYLPGALLCFATFVTLGNRVNAQLLLWRRVAVRKSKKQRKRGKHGISIENIAHDYPKNINHLNSWRCLCFLTQDLFKKSDQKLHMYDFSNLFSRTLLTIRHGSQCFFWTKMSYSNLNFISQEERTIKNFQFWIVEIVHCHIHGSAACSVTWFLNSAFEQMFSCHDLMKGPNHAIAR